MMQSSNQRQVRVHLEIPRQADVFPLQQVLNRYNPSAALRSRQENADGGRSWVVCSHCAERTSDIPVECCNSILRPWHNAQAIRQYWDNKRVNSTREVAGLDY